VFVAVVWIIICPCLRALLPTFDGIAANICRTLKEIEKRGVSDHSVSCGRASGTKRPLSSSNGDRLWVKDLPLVPTWAGAT